MGAADLVVVASPTYKATYTGLLKLFLDQFGAAEHALAGEHTLKPVLSEIGCSCPTPALFLLDSAWDSGPVLDTWVERARDVLAGLDAQGVHEHP